MRTLRIVSALALALTLVSAPSFAGVRDTTFVGGFNVDGNGDCDEMTFAFDSEDGVNVAGCTAVYNGTFSQLDLFFIGFWSLEASTSGSRKTQLILSGIETYFGARIYGSGKAFGATVRIYGVRQPSGGEGAAACGGDLWTAGDPRRSPERL